MLPRSKPTQQMNTNPTSTENGSEDELQPLREVRSLDKTQYWDREEIMQALRVANYRGIRLDSLYADNTSKTTSVPTRQAS